MGFSLPTRIQTSTLNAWLKEIEEPAYHSNPLLAMMRKRGRLKYKAGEIGKRVDWVVRYLRRKARIIGGDNTERSFVSTNTKLHAEINWTGLDMTERISKLERLINSNSETQIYKLVETTLREMMDDFLVDLALHFWQDGTIANEGYQGVLSLYGGSSTKTADGVYNGIGTYTPITPSDGVSNWWACAPSQTYAGLSTALGNKVDDFTSEDTSKAFPAGQFSEAYHFWSYIMCDYNSRYFTPTNSSSTHSWATQWQQSFNAVETYQSKLARVPVDMWILDADLLRQAKDSLIDNSRFIVTDSSEARSLGFKSLEYNGWEMLPGYGVPDGMGIGFTWDKMEYRMLQNQLVERTEDSDIATSDDLFLLDNYGALLFKSPKYFPALVPASTAGT